MNERTKAALIGGVIAGVLSGLPLVGGCCFLWAIAGGFLTVFLYMKNAPGPMEMGDAAKLGLIAGAIGAAISVVLGIPFTLLGIGAAATNPDLGRAGIGAGIMAVGGVVGLIIRAAVVAGCGALGGIIGAAILNKNQPGGPGSMPPPPPPPVASDMGFGGAPPSEPPPMGGNQ